MNQQPPLPPIVYAEQPQTIQMAPLPSGFTAPLGCHPSLAYLAQLDQLIVKQKKEMLEVITGWETRNKYQIMNNQNQQVFFAQEESGECMRQCCQDSRGFIMHITDNSNQEVIRVERKFKCCAGCCWCACLNCCAWQLDVECPPGNRVGYCKQSLSGWKPHFGIYDKDDKKVFEIWGPCCTFQCICCPREIDFPFYSAKDKDKVVAKVSKQWAGAVREIFTDADTFGVTFPVDLSMDMKAVVLGTVFMIDSMYYEHQQNNSHY